MNIAKKESYKCETIVIYLAVILSSFVGAQFMGISLNKISLIPLELFLILHSFKNVRINKLQRIMLIWYLLAVISAIIGLLDNKGYLGTNEKLTFFIIQVLFMYCPIILMSSYLHNPLRTAKKAVILMAKINAIWAIIQFISWYGIGFDINGFLFDDIFRGIFGNGWTVWNFEAGTLALRVSGFQRDSAFFAMLLILAFCMTNSKMWQGIFTLSCLLSISRTGLTVICFIILIRLFKMVKKEKVPKNTIAVGLGMVVIAIVVFLAAYFVSPSIRYQVDYTIYRFTSIFSNTDSGTTRHIMYIPFAIFVWAMEFNPIQKMFGIGARIGGVAFSYSSLTNKLIQMDGITAWAVESDIADLLLGQGICGLLIYVIIYKIGKREKNINEWIIAVAVSGIMYNVIETTLIQVLLIFAISCLENAKE